MGDESIIEQQPITLVSFGFKYGLPDGCAMVFDVRFLRNPYWVPALKEFNGNNEAVKAYVFDDPHTLPLTDKLTELILFSLPLYRPDPARHLTIGVGCTGGRHRSVAVVNELAARLTVAGYSVTTSHRDIDKDAAGQNGEDV
jgi:UPF0042 nucleotide-binding protein